MMLAVDNSMQDKASGDFTMCRLTLFAPYWVDNRCGMDLVFKDGPSAKGQPLLMGAHTYFDYALVKAPGISDAPLNHQQCSKPFIPLAAAGRSCLHVKYVS